MSSCGFVINSSDPFISPFARSFQAAVASKRGNSGTQQGRALGGSWYSYGGASKQGNSGTQQAGLWAAVGTATVALCSVDEAGACCTCHAGGPAVAVLCTGDGARAGHDGELWAAGGTAASARASSGEHCGRKLRRRQLKKKNRSRGAQITTIAHNSLYECCFRHLQALGLKEQLGALDRSRVEKGEKMDG
jgi:hypothetical protein